MVKNIFLAYEGYWREPNFQLSPEYSGVYTFMECKFDRVNNTVNLLRILYIGQAENVRQRIISHEKIDAMKRGLAYGNELCINCAPVVEPDKSRAEAALVYKHQPPFNDKLKDRFDYDETAVVNSGKYELLHQRFTVYKTVRAGGYYY